MSEIKKQVRLIMCDVDANNNKFWTGTLYDNDDVLVEWGRVGMAAQSKRQNKAGESFLTKKEKEKLNKGYTHLKTVAITPSKTTTVVVHDDLKTIAKTQIRTKSPVLEQLIDRLVQANIHQITSSTQITFDAKTGLFSTPLGIVTDADIKLARETLGNIKKNYSTDRSSVKASINEYLRLIPQNIGMKFNTDSLFGTDEAIVKQNDLLDSLESSYQAIQKPADMTGSPQKPLESVFNVEIDLLTDQKEWKRISDKFHATRKSIHTSYRLKVKNVYAININTVRTAFQTGKAVGNIQELWHGTKKANLLSILKNGLKVSPPSTAYIAGKMFGNGVYFSDQSTKSLNYAYGYWDGNYEKNCFMFLCDVAMGKSYTPSGPTSALPKPGYDSTYAEAGKSGVMNNEMIVYKENQVDLKYLVEFEE